MKNILFTVLTFAFMASYGIAQQYPGTDDGIRNQHKLGIKVGANIANVYDAEGEAFDAKGKAGLVIGAFLSLPISKYIGVQPEVLFSQKGFRSTGRLLGSDYELNRTLNYLDIPLLFAFKPIGAVTLLAGPQVSFLLKQTDAFKNDNITVLQEEEFKNENIRKNMLGFTGGLDINIKHFVVGARAGWDLMKNNGDGTTTTPRYKNAWVQGTFGIRLY